MLAEDAEAGAEDEKEVEELKKQGINPLPKPPPGVGLLPTPPRPVSVDCAGPVEFGLSGPSLTNMAHNAPQGTLLSPGTGPSPGPPPCSDSSPFHAPPNPGTPPQPPLAQPSPCQGAAGKKIPSLFEIVVQPTGQLAQKLGVRFAFIFSCLESG